MATGGGITGGHQGSYCLPYLPLFFLYCIDVSRHFHTSDIYLLHISYISIYTSEKKLFVVCELTPGQTTYGLMIYQEDTKKEPPLNDVRSGSEKDTTVCY